MMLGPCLGLTIDAAQSRVTFRRPFLPPCLRRIAIRNLQVGPAALDLSVDRYAEVVGIDILRREGAVEVLTVN